MRVGILALQGNVREHSNILRKLYAEPIKVKSSEDLTLEEVYRSGELVTRTVSPKSRIVWGAKVNPEMQGSAHVFVCLTGVESAFLTQQPKRRFGLGRFFS